MVAREYNSDCRKGLVLENGKPYDMEKFARDLYLRVVAERLKKKKTKKKTLLL